MIRARQFAEGSIVRAGQTLYQIDPSLYQASVDQAQANLASAQATTHTLRFTSVELSSINFSKTHFGQADVDRNRAHQKIGFDTLNGVFDPKTNSVKIDVSFDAKGGFMYFHLHSTSPNSYAGKMTGGTGRFRHATGTITAKNLNSAGTRTAVKIIYTV